MESQLQRWVNLAYLAFAALVAYLLLSGTSWMLAFYNLETRNTQLWLRVGAVVVAAAVFAGLYFHERTNQFMNEVMVELSRVTWPTARDTSSATFVVIVMVLISGFVLGVFDWICVGMMNWVLGLFSA